MVLLKPLSLLLVALICADVQGTRESALNDTIPRLDTTENYLVGRTGECVDSDQHLQRGLTVTLYGQNRHGLCRESCDVRGACTAYATQDSEPTCTLYYGAVVQGSGVYGYTCYIKIPTESATCVDIAPPRLWGNPTCELQLRNTNHCAERLAGTLQDYFCYSTCGVCSPRAANHRGGGVERLRELAAGKPASQSSEHFSGGDPWRGVDGNPSITYADSSCTHTGRDISPWWRVDLEKPFDIVQVEVWNRGDCCSDRINGAEIKLSNVDDVNSATTCATISSMDWSETFDCVGTARYLFIQIPEGNTFLTLCEVKVWGPEDQEEAPPASSNSSLIGSSESRNLTGFWNSSLIGLCEECVDDEMCEEGLVCHERKPFDTLPPRCALPPGTFDPRFSRSRKYCAPPALPDKDDEGQCTPVSTSTADAGYVDDYRGWYSLSGDGCCNDYCRWVGDSGAGGDPAERVVFGSSRWDCRLAGGTAPYSGSGYFTSFSYSKCAARGIPDNGCFPGCATCDGPDEYDCISCLDGSPITGDDDNDGAGRCTIGGTTESYTHTTPGCVNGQNIVKYADKTVEECAALCDEYGSGCKGFEYGVAHGGGGTSYNPGDCQLSSSAATAGCDGSNFNLDFYTKVGEVEAPSEAPTVSVEVGCNETLSGDYEAGYKGCQNTTSWGRTCQKWTSQSPHPHVRTPEAYPDKNLGDHNYCRNPDNEPEGIWCYTTDPNSRWEYCDPISDETEQEAVAPIGHHVNSFSVGGMACYYKNSPAITQYFASIDNDSTLKSLLAAAFYMAYMHQHGTQPKRLREDDDTAVIPSTWFLPNDIDYNNSWPNIWPKALRHHIIWGRTVYANMLDTREMWSSPLTRSRSLRVSRDENGDLLVDCYAKIDLMDIETCLGIVHVIDRRLNVNFDHCATTKTNNSTINTDGIADSNIFGADVSPLTGQGEEKQAATDTKRTLLDQLPWFFFVVAPLLLGFVVVSVVLTRRLLKLRTLTKRANALNPYYDIERADTTALQRRIWEWIDSKELLFVQKLGRGGAGVVYYAKWRSTDVAVKVLGPEGRKHTNKLSYSELDTLCLCRHPNILSLYGVAGDREGGEMFPPMTSPVASPRMAFVTELACCSLADLLVEGFQRTAAIQDLLSMAQGVAAGLEYLHNREKGATAICHMDIKPGNILIKHGMCPCIGDFGSALVGAHRRTMADLTGLMITPGYVAPELIKASQCTATIDTLAVDVFAYGLVLKHMFTSSPIKGSRLVEDQWDRANMHRNPEEKLAEQVMPELPQSAVQMMTSMLAREPSARPTISTIAQVLATALQQSSAGDAQSEHNHSSSGTRSPLPYDYPGTKSKFQTGVHSTGITGTTLELSRIAQAMFDTASVTTSAGLLQYQSGHTSEHTSVPFGPSRELWL